MVNQVILVGTVVKPVDAKLVGQNTLLTKVVIKTSESMKKNGETQYKDSFHTITFWGDGWHWLQERLGNGKKVYIEGKLDYSNYENSKGDKVYQTNIIGHKVQVVGD